jgi:signal transduction histidine kinase/DNA-binding NarL/FixJ family response regulator/ligand-binding sensor domain-containing protein
MIDRTGVLWVGTESKGLAYTDLYAKGFHIIRPGKTSEKGLSDNLVTAIAGTGNRIWVVTAAGGFDVFSNQASVISKLNNIPRITIDNQQSSKEVMALLLDSDDQLWIGSATNSISVYKKPDDFKSYPVDGFVFSLLEDTKGRIWFGTWGQGLGYVNEQTEQTERYNGTSAISLGLSSDKVLSVFEDSSGLLWVGTKGGGINVCNIDKVVARTGEFVTYRNEMGDTESLSYNDVYDILEDQQGNVWLATGSGLNKVVFDQNKGLNESAENGTLSFLSYAEKEGLAGGLVLFVEEDEKGHLWLGTNKGISKFDPKTEVFTNYGVNDGLPSGEFHVNASYKDLSTGMMYFGVDGVAVFHPDSMKTNPFPPRMQVTGLRLHNDPVYPGEKANGKVILEENITYTDHLTLSHSNNELTFEFSALHFSNPGKIRYAFRLKGFNDSWQETNSENRRATYTNLNEGDYVFEVKASDSSGEWSSEVAEIPVTIQPPFWRTLWAYMVYVQVVFLLFAFRKYYLIGKKQKNSLIIESLQNKKDRELTEAKMRFFTNISHEIRTPLTLIYAPLQEILNRDDINKEVHGTLSVMHRNVKRLLNMVNQLLEFRKLDTGHSELHPARFNLVELSHDTLTAFNSLAGQKNIDVKIDAPEEIWLIADEKMISTALYNLLSNAMKFTPSGGQVFLRLQYSGENHSSGSGKVIISVCDSGPGIPEHHLERVFDRFRQVKTGTHSHLAGSGIGLSIVKEFVVLHHGQVKVYNKNEGGCCFEIVLPEKVESEAIIEDHSQDVLFTEQQTDESFDLVELVEDEAFPDEELLEKPVMCIVEDDHELARWLAAVFRNEFNVSVFHDGKEGLAEIVSLMPDIIVCDLMLPGLQGTDLTRSVKKRFETSHIPVVMLTAKTGDDSVLEGLKTGADSYITKPFNINILRAQVQSLVNSRLAFKKRFAGKLSLEPSEEMITPADEKFLSKLMEVTESKMGDPSFDVSVLVDDMHMSHSIILKKVKSMTGLSLVEFIRSMRIKKAAQIFRQDKLSVSEVSFMVGFSDPKYFSKCFSRQIGKKPTEYIKDHHM